MALRWFSEPCCESQTRPCGSHHDRDSSQLPGAPNARSRYARRPGRHQHGAARTRRDGAMPGIGSGPGSASGGVADVPRPTTGGTPRSARRRSIRVGQLTSPSSAARAACILISAVRNAGQHRASTESRTSWSTGRQAKQAVTFDYWDESDGVDSVPERAFPSIRFRRGHRAAALDRRRRPRQRGRARATAPADHRLHQQASLRAVQRLLLADAGAVVRAVRARSSTWTATTADRRAGPRPTPPAWRSSRAWCATTKRATQRSRDPARLARDGARNQRPRLSRHRTRAGNTAGALPMGARLRLKASVNGTDPALRTSDPIARKIFRAMQKYGLIVADNGSDMYISGTFDVRWDNGGPEPRLRSAQGQRLRSRPARLEARRRRPHRGAQRRQRQPEFGDRWPVSHGQRDADGGGANGWSGVALASASSAFSVPSSVIVAQGTTSATLPINTIPTSTQASGSLSATYAGVTRTTVMTVTPTPSPSARAVVCRTQTPLVLGSASARPRAESPVRRDYLRPIAHQAKSPIRRTGKSAQK